MTVPMRPQQERIQQRRITTCTIVAAARSEVPSPSIPSARIFSGETQDKGSTAKSQTDSNQSTGGMVKRHTRSRKHEWHKVYRV